MKALYFTLLTFIVFGCSSNGNNTEYEYALKKDIPQVSIIDRATLPDNVISYIESKLPGMQIPDTSDYIKSWWSFYERGTFPYFVTVDLNNDLKTDYALLLKAPKSLKLVFLIDSAGSFSHTVTAKEIQTFADTVKNIQYGLAIEYPGRTDCVVNGFEQSLVLKDNGVTVMEHEFKDIIFYFENGTINKFNVR